MDRFIRAMLGRILIALGERMGEDKAAAQDRNCHTHPMAESRPLRTAYGSATFVVLRVLSHRNLLLAGRIKRRPLRSKWLRSSST